RIVAQIWRGSRRRQKKFGNVGRAEYTGHRAAQQQVVDRLVFECSLPIVGAAEIAVFRIAIAQRDVQGSHERHVLQKRNQQLAIGLLDVVSTLAVPGAQAAQGTGERRDRFGDQFGRNGVVGVLLVVIQARRQLHSTRRQIEKAATDI